ncbi:hypothetical protein [Pseudonocardia adelaidensis]|uniref:hypothetical protein n=1 Tax=Pseudonocardia adelaidensis TaxID=648754 RepID=UPI0031E54941
MTGAEVLHRDAFFDDAFFDGAFFDGAFFDGDGRARCGGRSRGDAGPATYWLG